MIAKSVLDGGKLCACPLFGIDVSVSGPPYAGSSHAPVSELVPLYSNCNLYTERHGSEGREYQWNSCMWWITRSSRQN